jgi:hypothetical protein
MEISLSPLDIMKLNRHPGKNTWILMEAKTMPERYFSDFFVRKMPQEEGSRASRSVALT